MSSGAGDNSSEVKILQERQHESEAELQGAKRELQMQAQETDRLRGVVADMVSWRETWNIGKDSPYYIIFFSFSL